MSSPFSYSRVDLPEGWNKRRLGSLLQFRNGQDISGTDFEFESYPVYGSGGEFKRTNQYLFEGPSILFGRKGTIDKPLLVDGRFWTVDTMFYTVPGPDVDPRFVHYWALVAPLSVLSTNTAVPSMTSTDLAQLYLVVPPLPTQRAIAGYLDRETAEIDGMRADLDEMERLLTERRAAVISQATLNHDGKSLAAGNPIDGANDLAPLWKFAEVSPPTPEFAELTGNDEVTFIPLEDVWPTYEADDFQTMNWETRLTGYTPFRCGDLLLPKVTPTVTHGRTMITNITTNVGVASTEVYTIRARRSTDPSWLANLLVGTEFLALAGASVQGTGGLKRISTQFVESYPLPNIALGEQRRIAEKIDRETAEIDSMLVDIKELRDLLTERRAAVISAAVTGQIDIPASPTTKDESHA